MIFHATLYQRKGIIKGFKTAYRPIPLTRGVSLPSLSALVRFISSRSSTKDIPYLGPAEDYHNRTIAKYAEAL